MPFIIGITPLVTTLRVTILRDTILRDKSYSIGNPYNRDN